MWFGTESGIQKYDGYTFKSFHHEPSDSNSIPEGRIGGLFEDPNNDIWVKPILSDTVCSILFKNYPNKVRN
jgi:hypothetical protein